MVNNCLPSWPMRDVIQVWDKRGWVCMCWEGGRMKSIYADDLRPHYDNMHVTTLQ
jgi:hypothetical protein